MALACLLAGPAPSRAEDALPAAEDTPQVVEPKVHRRDVTVPAIDTENVEAGLFVGTISIQDFGTSMLYGGRIAYHFTEDVYAEATVGTAKAGKTS
ncbi:MAG TPA: hypothetical protein VLU24_06565, partial [Mycobacterium sp.]|nr:hypothetical protein [Mycobacterium sp.]